MAKRSKQYSFHLNLNNPDHLKIYRTLEDLNTDIHKSVSNFVIKAVIQYINDASRSSLTKSGSLITQKQETLDMQKDLFLDAKQEQLTKLSKLDEFDEEVIRYLIDYVLVYDNEHIEIRWNFDDFQAG